MLKLVLGSGRLSCGAKVETVVTLACVDNIPWSWCSGIVGACCCWCCLDIVVEKHVLVVGAAGGRALAVMFVG